jgi:hypothetical protein
MLQPRSALLTRVRMMLQEYCSHVLLTLRLFLVLVSLRESSLCLPSRKHSWPSRVSRC